MSDAKGLVMAKAYQEKAYGHPEIWECTLEEFIKKVSPELQDQWTRNNLKHKVVKLAADFLRLKFDGKELKGTIKHEVAKSIEESLIYFVNVLDEDA